MKVLHIINNLGSGGAEKMLIDFVNVKKEVQIEVLLLIDDTISYTLPKSFTYKVLSNSKKRFSILKLYKLYKYIKKNDYDIIHTHLFPTQYYVAIVKLLLGNSIKLVTTEHSTTNTRRKYWFTRQIDKLMYSTYNKVIFISEGVKKQFLIDFPSFKDKGVIVNNGIDLENFISITKNNSVSSTEIKLLMTARFGVQKDHKTLIKALNLLDEKYTLTLAGEGVGIDMVKELVSKLNLQKRVHFLGFTKDIKKIYQNHDIFVLSSHWEGFGLVVVEAMAASLPVIVSNVAGLKEVVGEAGLLFEKGDEKELAQKIKLLGENIVLREEYIAKGQEYIKKYDIKILIEKTIKLYRQL